MLSDYDALTIINLAKQTPVIQVGGNSTMTRVEFENRYYAVKDYSARADGNQRLTQEFSALEFLHPELPDRFAEPLGIGTDGQRAIYSWIDGVRPALDRQSVTHMLDIANELHHLSKSATQELVKPATDQVLNINDIGYQLVKRFETLQAVPGPVADFTKTQIFPLLLELRIGDDEAGRASITLSPSDFGAHNLLWDEATGQMKCVDLEFFGWDDAHKLTCDSLLHPLADWSVDLAETFLSGAFTIYNLDEERLLWLWPLLNLKWAAITLSRSQRNLREGGTTRADQAMLRAVDYVKHAKCAPASTAEILDQVTGA